MACIEARGLRKQFGSTIALDGIEMRVEEGRILGLIGPERRGQDHCAQCHSRAAPYQGELEFSVATPGRSAISSCAMSRSLPMLPFCRAG